MRQRDAASGRRQGWPPDVDEHGAAATGDAGPRVVIDLNKDVVEVIVAPKPVAWFIGRPPEGAVVAPVGGIFAPRIGAADAAKG